MQTVDFQTKSAERGGKGIRGVQNTILGGANNEKNYQIYERGKKGPAESCLQTRKEVGLKKKKGARSGGGKVNRQAVRWRLGKGGGARGPLAKDNGMVKFGLKVKRERRFPRGAGIDGEERDSHRKGVLYFNGGGGFVTSYQGSAIRTGRRKLQKRPGPRIPRGKLRVRKKKTRA